MFPSLLLFVPDHSASVRDVTKFGDLEVISRLSLAPVVPAGGGAVSIDESSVRLLEGTGGLTGEGDEKASGFNGELGGICEDDEDEDDDDEEEGDALGGRGGEVLAGGTGEEEARGRSGRAGNKEEERVGGGEEEVTKTRALWARMEQNTE